MKVGLGRSQENFSIVAIAIQIRPSPNCALKARIGADPCASSHSNQATRHFSRLQCRPSRQVAAWCRRTRQVGPMVYSRTTRQGVRIEQIRTFRIRKNVIPRHHIPTVIPTQPQRPLDGRARRGAMRIIALAGDHARHGGFERPMLATMLVDSISSSRRW